MQFDNLRRGHLLNLLFLSQFLCDFVISGIFRITCNNSTFFAHLSSVCFNDNLFFSMDVSSNNRKVLHFFSFCSLRILVSRTSD